MPSALPLLPQAAVLPPPLTAGSTHAYARAVQRLPMLSTEEEQELLERKDRDADAARSLVMSHLRMVVAVARGYLGYGLPQADLIQEGNIGLMKAVRSFQPGHDARLSSYAIHWIRSEIHEYIIRNWRMVRLATTKAQRKLFFNLRSMKQDRAALKEGEALRIAAALGVKPAEVLEMDRRMGGADVSFAAGNDGDEHVVPEDYLSDESFDPVRRAELARRQRLESDGLRHALDSLDDRSRRIVEARWLADDPHTLRSLASELKISPERVRQVQEEALLRMKRQLSRREWA